MVSLDRLQFGDQCLQAGFGVAEKHAGVRFEEERVFDPGEAEAIERLRTKTVRASSTLMIGMP